MTCPAVHTGKVLGMGKIDRRSLGLHRFRWSNHNIPHGNDHLFFGFLPITDKRVQSTINRVVAELSWNGLLRRYRTDETDDGITGSEGAFLWCTFWLVRNLTRMGRLEAAAKLYQKLIGYGNHLNLFPEMVDPASGELLGNFPQALTHLAVIIAGLELTEATKDNKKETISDEAI